MRAAVHLSNGTRIVGSIENLHEGGDLLTFLNEYDWMVLRSDSGRDPLYVRMTQVVSVQEWPL